MITKILVFYEFSLYMIFQKLTRIATIGMAFSRKSLKSYKGWIGTTPVKNPIYT